MTRRTRTEAGVWREGSASPKLLPGHLRRLPGDLQARDIDDPDKAHELDAPHVVRDLMRDYATANNLDGTPEKKTAKGAIKKLRAPGPGETAPVVQWYVDVARIRVIAQLIGKAVSEWERGLDPNIEAPFYLWFPVNNANEYHLRRGVPPPNRERPKHLRNIDLRVDMLDPPKSVLGVLKDQGVDFELDVRKRIEAAKEASRVVALA